MNQPQPTTPLRGEVQPCGGFHSPKLMQLAREARAKAGSKWAIIKPKRVARAVLWRGRPFYWTAKGYYRGGTGDRRPLQQLIWEDHTGRTLARGWEIFFGDRDRHNFTPANLEAHSKADLHRRLCNAGENSLPTHEQRSRGRGLANTRKSRSQVASLLQSHLQTKKESHERNAPSPTVFLAQRRAVTDRETARLYRSPAAGRSRRHRLHQLQ